MNKKIKSSVIIALMISTSVSICCFFIVENKAFATLMSVFVYIFSLLICDYKKNITMLAFMVCFFVFLIGRPFAFEIIGYSGYSIIPLNLETKTFVYVCLVISLVFIMCGYLVGKKIKPKDYIDEDNKTKVIMMASLKKVTKYVAIIFYLLAVIENIMRFFYVKNVGYTASYALDYDYGLPYGLHYLVLMAPVTFALFLATLPSKREALIPISLFVISNLLFALSGNRFEIVSCLLAVIIYCVWRNDTDENKWITGKQMFCLVAITPFVVILMQYMIYWREGRDVNTEINPVVGFLHSTGGSASIIGAVKQYEGRGIVNNDIVYSFGGVWKGLNGNIISKSLGFGKTYKTQTVNYAKNAHSLSSALTYYFAPEKYLSGYGLGGCYIAELYNDFSMLGVIVGNLLVGIVIGLISELKKNKVFHNFLCFFVMILLLRLPRDSFDYPITSLFNLKNFLLIVIVFLIAKRMSIVKRGVAEGSSV